MVLDEQLGLFHINFLEFLSVGMFDQEKTRLSIVFAVVQFVTDIKRVQPRF